MTRNSLPALLIPPAIVLTSVLFSAAGCSGGEAADRTAQDQGAPAAVDAAALPAGLFLTQAPAEILSLREARTTAAVGDEVAFEARIGGRVEPFTTGSAMFLVADLEILTCTQRHGDGCPTPWDYCCEPKDNLQRNMATVQIVDASGRPILGSIKGLEGLDPMARVVVVGTVTQSDGPTFVVDATGIYVRGLG